MLDLSRVTLLFVETRAHAITARVIEDCLSKATFGAVLIYTDQPDRIPVPGARYISVPDFPNKREAGMFYYGEAMANVSTDFALMLEWDAGIFDPAKWRPEFFNYDYIGAPWMVGPGDTQDVGNGGFTLMSRSLGLYVYENRKRLPVTTDWDFCRVQRRHYEAAGFKWPKRDLASLFAWELGPRNPEHFGFHGAFTWPYVLTRAEVIERATLLTQTPYLLTKMTDLVKHAPWLETELAPADWAKYRALYPAVGVRPATVFPSNRQRAMQLVVQQRRNLAMSFINNNSGQKA